MNITTMFRDLTTAEKTELDAMLSRGWVRALKAGEAGAAHECEVICNMLAWY